jgi:hypothetical protein
MAVKKKKRKQIKCPTCLRECGHHKTALEDHEEGVRTYTVLAFYIIIVIVALAGSLVIFSDDHISNPWIVWAGIAVGFAIILTFVYTLGNFEEGHTKEKLKSVVPHYIFWIGIVGLIVWHAPWLSLLIMLLLFMEYFFWFHNPYKAPKNENWFTSTITAKGIALVNGAIMTLLSNISYLLGRSIGRFWYTIISFIWDVIIGVWKFIVYLAPILFWGCLGIAIILGFFWLNGMKYRDKK